MTETEISLFTPLMGNFLTDIYMRTIHRLQNTNMTDGTVRALTDDTKKFI